MTGFEALQQLRLPDAWQAEAIRALAAGDDVIVQAPTGAGKTFIFEQYFQQRRGPGQVDLHRADARAGQRQIRRVDPPRLARRHHDRRSRARSRRRRWSSRRSRRSRSPTSAALYVIDEYQWLADPLRGNHYEGTILSLPRATQLLLLSGSVANPGAVRDWLLRLERGRNVTLIEQRERPVPLEETEIDSLARHVPEAITGYWTRRIAGALRDDLGPILVFAPHRREAEKIARDVAARIPCPQPLRLTKDQENAAGPDLAKLLGQRVAFHHSGLSYVQRAGLIEPLAKGGQLRVVVATLGLSAGINFSLRSVLVTATSFTAGGFPREVTPSDLLQMFGRAGRRGLDDQGYVLVSERSPRLGPGAGGTSAPQRAVAVAAAAAGAGEGRASSRKHARHFRSKLFTTEFIPLGIESTQKIAEPLPCGLKTDAGRARLVRRVKDPAPFCLPCPHRAECLTLDPKPTLHLALESRRAFSTSTCSSRGAGGSWPASPARRGSACWRGWRTRNIRSLICSRTWRISSRAIVFAGTSRAGAGGSPMRARRRIGASPATAFSPTACRSITARAARRSSASLRTKKYVPMEGLEEHVHRGDVDRLLIEWKSLLRQIADGNGG